MQDKADKNNNKHFYKLAGFITDRAGWVLTVCIILLMAMLSFLPKIQFDTTTEGFLSENDEAIQRYESFKDQFGRDDYIVLAIHHPDIFSHTFITGLSELHASLKSGVSWLSDIDSLINARRIIGENDDLIVEDLFEEIPEQDAPAYYQKKAREVVVNPLYQRLLIDKSGEYTALMLRIKNKALKASGDYEPVSDQELDVSIVETRAIVDAWEVKNPEATVYMAGSPLIVSKLKQAMMQDMRKFTLLTLLVISLILFLLFGRLSGVILPIVVVIFSVLSTLGLMAATGAKIQLPTVILPSFILAVAIGDSVHFLTIFYQNFSQGSGSLGDSLSRHKALALQAALGHTGVPMLLTSLTTAAGLASFSFAEIVPVSNLGLFAAVGVMLAFLLSIILLPASLMLLPLKPAYQKRGSYFVVSGLFDRGLKHFTELCIGISRTRPKTIIVIYLSLSLLALMAASQLRFSHDPVLWLPDDWEIKKATRIVDEKLRGTVSIEILIDTGQDDGVKNPAFLKNLDRINHQIENYQSDKVEVRKVISIVDIIKESNQSLHKNQKAYYAIPDQQDLVAQELFLLELSGADDLYDLVDKSYRSTRVTISIPWIDTIHYQDLLSFIVKQYRQGLADEIQVTYTGIVPILGNTLKAVITSTAVSYAIAFVVICILMVVMLGSFKYGLLAMLPNIIPITFTLAMMYAFSIPVDMFTMLIASIALGLSVDDTIHFMHHFKQGINSGASVNSAISFTLHTSGKAMLTTTIVLCCGFMIYTFSQMNNLDTFGAFTAITVALALLADFLLAPALMIVSHKQEH